MKNVFKKAAAVLAVATMATAAFSLVSCGDDRNYAKDNTKIKIGISAPLTGDEVFTVNRQKTARS